MYPLAIEFDVVPLWMDVGAGDERPLAIDYDSSFVDVPFGVPSRGNTGFSEEFFKTHYLFAQSARVSDG